MDMQRRPLFVWCILLGLLVASAPAWAQRRSGGKPGSKDAMGSLGNSNAAPGDRTWAEGVSEADQETAKKLFEEGNKLLRDSLFLPAVQKYREALELWDHPGIHYNLSLALMNLDQPIEVYHSLQKAMAHGPVPLDQDKFDRAKSYLALVEKQLARVEIVCDEPDAKVTMDGQLLFTAPGRHEGLVRVGEHTIVATKRGYLTQNEQLALSPSEQRSIEIRLVSLADVTVTKRRWAEWKPWAVVGGGTAVALAGGVLHWRSSANFNGFDKDFNQNCQSTGCRDSEIPGLIDRLDRANFQQNTAVISYAVGGTVVAAGLVLLYLNRPQVFRKDLDELEGTDRISILPTVSPGAAGVTAGFRF